MAHPSARTEIIYYVGPTGNDTTGDGSQSNPWLTRQHAVDQIPLIDSHYYYTINLAAGIAPENVVLPPWVSDFSGAGSSGVFPVTLRGYVTFQATPVAGAAWTTGISAAQGNSNLRNVPLSPGSAAVDAYYQQFIKLRVSGIDKLYPISGNADGSHTNKVRAALSTAPQNSFATNIYTFGDAFTVTSARESFALVQFNYCQITVNESEINGALWNAHGCDFVFGSTTLRTTRVLFNNSVVRGTSLTHISGTLTFTNCVLTDLTIGGPARPIFSQCRWRNVSTLTAIGTGGASLTNIAIEKNINQSQGIFATAGSLWTLNQVDISEMPGDAIWCQDATFQIQTAISSAGIDGGPANGGVGIHVIDPGNVILAVTPTITGTGGDFVVGLLPAGTWASWSGNVVDGQGQGARLSQSGVLVLAPVQIASYTYTQRNALSPRPIGTLIANSDENGAHQQWDGTVWRMAYSGLRSYHDEALDPNLDPAYLFWELNEDPAGGVAVDASGHAHGATWQTVGGLVVRDSVGLLASSSKGCLRSLSSAPDFLLSDATVPVNGALWSLSFWYQNVVIADDVDTWIIGTQDSGVFVKIKRFSATGNWQITYKISTITRTIDVTSLFSKYGAAGQIAYDAGPPLFLMIYYSQVHNQGIFINGNPADSVSSAATPPAASKLMISDGSGALTDFRISDVLFQNGSVPENFPTPRRFYAAAGRR
jgi:hypothetical protein